MLQISSEGVILDVKAQQEVAITYTNPFFESDRCAVAITTSIEFEATPQTRRIFQFIPSMLMKPQRRSLPATLILGGLPICDGTLEYDEYSESSLKYTFKGAAFEDAVAGKLNEVPLRTFEKIQYRALVDNVRKGVYPEFGLPMLIRKSDVAKLEYKTDPNINAFPEVGVMTKFPNWLLTETPYFIPAIYLYAILRNVLPGLVVESNDLEHYLQNTAILGLHKDSTMRNNCGIQLTDDGGDPEALYCNVKLNLADSLPGMSVADFIINILKMTCSTLYSEGKHYVLRTNEDILTSEHYINWTAKVSDSYSCAAEKPQAYTLSFANESDSYTPASSDPMYQSSAPIIYECQTMEAVLNKVNEFADYVNVKHSPSGDIYSGKRTLAVLFYDRLAYWEDMWSNVRTMIPSLDVVHQAGFTKKETKVGVDAEAYDCAIDFEVPRCIPVDVHTTAPIGTFPRHVRAVTPIVEIPAIGAERSSKIYIGRLIQNNFVDKKNFFSGNDDNQEGVGSTSLTVDDLFETFHRSYAEWLGKDKDPRSVNLNLMPSDLQKLELWSKHLIFNQRWFIRKLEVAANTSTDLVTCTADITEA